MIQVFRVRALRISFLLFSFDFNISDPEDTYKYYEDPDIEEWKDHLEEGRKFRIMMRGIKIGRRKGGGRFNMLNIFETNESK